MRTAKHDSHFNSRRQQKELLCLLYLAEQPAGVKTLKQYVHLLYKNSQGCQNKHIIIIDKYYVTHTLADMRTWKA